MSKQKTIQEISDFQCTGCGSCAAVCPVKAISMVQNDEGFFYPEIDTETCICCGKCFAQCPVHNVTLHDAAPHFYALQLKDEEALHRSASGGFFYGIAAYMIANQGIVAGCVLDDQMQCINVCTDSMDVVKKMQGSKYIQSFVPPEVYRQIKQYLSDGVRVFFSGTPCQIAGLKQYLDCSYENLITMDLICHGVGSPGVFQRYIQKKERELKTSVKDVQFRPKGIRKYPDNHYIMLKDWKDNVVYCKYSPTGDPYGAAFYHNRILRESCYQCPWACRFRCADLTAGDYGGGKQLPFKSEDGFSVVCINTEKGRHLLDEVRPYFEMVPLDRSYTQINLSQPTLRPQERDKMKKVQLKQDDPDYVVEALLQVTGKDRLKALLPQGLKDPIKKFIRRIRR